MRKQGLIAALLFLAACASASRLNRLSIGMNKNQVIEQLGDPESTAATGEKEVLVYYFDPNGNWSTREYWVILMNGKVSMFGVAGDFGTYNPPTNKVILDQKVKVEGL